VKDLDKFSDEEKKHLNYLGSMLSKPNNALTLRSKGFSTVQCLGKKKSRALRTISFVQVFGDCNGGKPQSCPRSLSGPQWPALFFSWQSPSPDPNFLADPKHCQALREVEELFDGHPDSVLSFSTVTLIQSRANPPSYYRPASGFGHVSS
jgi:hypothetical protein